jgi:hypothetical protein
VVTEAEPAPLGHGDRGDDLLLAPRASHVSRMRELAIRTVMSSD